MSPERDGTFWEALGRVWPTVGRMARSVASRPARHPIDTAILLIIGCIATVILLSVYAAVSSIGDTSCRIVVPNGSAYVALNPREGEAVRVAAGDKCDVKLKVFSRTYVRMKTGPSWGFEGWVKSEFVRKREAGEP